MKYVVANFKMKMNLKDLGDWIDGFDKGKIENLDNMTVIVSPSSVHVLPYFLEYEDSALKIGAQDVSLYEKGAHTGETGAFQLKEFCKYCIVGHSERKEPLEIVQKKLDLCLENGITPIVCFVDPNRAADYYKDGVLLAWEDPENISKDGHYNPKDPNIVSQTIEQIKQKLPENAMLLYGGSVNGQTIADLVNISKLDGVLIGSASLDPKEFSQIIAAYL